MLITGNSADGSDARIARGVYVSPDGESWSNQPFTREQVAYDKVYDHCARYNKSFETLYEQLKAGSKQNLPKWVRLWFIKEYEEQNIEEVKVDLKQIL